MARSVTSDWPSIRRAFGKVRAPVKVTLNGYTYGSTIAAMGGPPCIPLRKSHREAAGLEGGETLDVRVELDKEKREIATLADLLEAFKAMPGALEGWRALSYTHQREQVEAIDDAKRPETRARRIAAAARTIRDQAKQRNVGSNSIRRGSSASGSDDA